VEGQDITSDVVVDGGGKIIDLMDALKQSLAKAPKAEKEAKEAPAKKGRKAS
jgi:non-homologous end joining protein Ku